MNKRLVFFLLAIIPVFIQSCKEDEEPDPVSQAEGTYNYRIKIHVADGTDLEYLGSAYDATGSAILTKTSQGFEVKEGGEVVFKGTKVAKASNGFTFDIESQTISVDGDDVTVDGFDGADLGGVKYNGLYLTASKQLTGFLKFDGIFIDENDNEFEVTFVFEFIGTKV